MHAYKSYWTGASLPIVVRNRSCINRSQNQEPDVALRQRKRKRSGFTHPLTVVFLVLPTRGQIEPFDDRQRGLKELGDEDSLELFSFLRVADVSSEISLQKMAPKRKVKVAGDERSIYWQ